MSRSIKKEYEELMRAGVSPSDFSVSDYVNFVNEVERAKEHISKKLGGKRLLIPILSEDDMEEQRKRDFASEFKKVLRDRYKTGIFLLRTLSLVNQNKDTLLENKTKNGKRFTKELKETFLGSEYEETVDDVILLYSQIKNSFVSITDAYLVISVDPFDFLTMGIGRGWTTCYKPGGEYQLGPLSIAKDSVSFLTYVTKGDSLRYDAKLYRRLGVIDEKMTGVMLSTQYPYKNASFEKITLDTISDYFFNGEFKGENNRPFRVFKTVSSQTYNDFTMSREKSFCYIGAEQEKDKIVRTGVRLGGK